MACRYVCTQKQADDDLHVLIKSTAGSDSSGGWAGLAHELMHHGGIYVPGTGGSVRPAA